MSVLRLAPLAGLLALLIAGPASAQSDSRVVWSFTARKIDARTYEVHMTATIQAGWHLYSQVPSPDHSPTQFTFTKSPLVVPIARTAEVGRLITAPDSAFDAKRRYYQNSVDFVQKVRVKEKAPAALTGSVRFTAASDYAMLPATKEFTVALK